MKTHFEPGLIPQYEKTLSRDLISRQERKICYGCQKGFNKKRCKAEEVSNRPGRYICQQCSNDITLGKSIENLRVL